MLQPSEEVKSRIDIVDLIREYLTIKPAGLNFKGLCPFHREKTPSFMVSPEKQIWHCFGCGRGGDIFSFVMEMENVDFVEALMILAPKAGVVLKKEDKKAASVRGRLLEIMELCRRYYHQILMAPEAAPARDYLAKRGLDSETIEEWQIGASPNSWDHTINFLKKRGFSENEIFSAGLSVKSQNKPGFYDRFRGRIMFPVMDLNGNTVAFTARVSPEREGQDQMGKYINSPQTAIYEKSRILFGLDKAKPEIKKADSVIIVEGQMDAIAAHQFGFKNTVASSGTALTADQIEILARRYTKNFLFALDFDDAGAQAIDRGGETAAKLDSRQVKAADPSGKEKIYIDPSLGYNLNVKIIEIPSGAKDPDECIRQNLSGWREAVKNAKPIMLYYFEKITTGRDVAKIEDKKAIAREFLTKIVKLSDKIERDFWLKKLSDKIDVSETVLRETLEASRRQVKTVAPESGGSGAKCAADGRSRAEKLSELLLALMFKFPALLIYSINHFQPDYLAGKENQALYRNLLFYYNKSISENSIIESENSQMINFGSFKFWLSEQSPEGKSDAESISLTGKLDQIAILGDSEYCDFSPEQAKSEAIGFIRDLKKNYLLGRMNELEKLISQYEKEKKEQNLKELMAEFKVLSDELRETNAE